MTKTRLFIAIIFLYTVAGVHANQLAFNIIVSPPRVEMRMQPGSSRQIVLTVQNRGEEPVMLDTRVFDLGMDRDGNSMALPAGTGQYSCSSWIKSITLMDTETKTVLKRKAVNADGKISLQPNEIKKMSVEMNVPYGVNGGRYSIVLFEAAGSSQISMDGLLLKGRVGSLIMLDLYGRRTLNAEVNQFRADHENANVNFKMIVKNTGDTHFRMACSIIIKKEGKIIDRVSADVGTGTVLPGYEREFTAMWKNERKMIPGAYYAELRVRIPGLGKYIRKEIEFNIHK